MLSVPLSCVVPQSAQEDQRINDVMSQFMEDVNFKMEGGAIEVITKPGPEIDHSNRLPVILPCCATGGVLSGTQSAFAKSKIGKCGQIIKVWS